MQFDIIKNKDLDELNKLQPEGWPDIIPDFEFYIKSDYCYPIKIVLDAKIVGVGTSIIFGKTSWIAHIIVDLNYRNKGLGYEIVNKLLENIKIQSVETCSLIATELGQPIYTKLGFNKVTEYCFLKSEGAIINYSFCKNIVPFKNEYTSMIYEFDKIISGENREKLLGEYINKSFIFIDKQKVLGYYIPDLKEGPIFAINEEAGLELMNFKYSKVDKAVLPSDNIVGIDFLKKNGFAEVNKKGTRMIFGKEINWLPKKIYSRIGGNFG
jgi:hypothetical protein